MTFCLQIAWLYSFIKLMAYCLQNLERNISQKMVQNTLCKLTYLWTLQTQNKNNLKSFLSCGDKWSLHVSYWLLLPQRREMSVLSVHRRTCLQVRKHIWHPPSVPGLGHVFIRFLMFLLFIRCSEGFTGQRCQFKKAMKFQSPGITGKGSKYFFSPFSNIFQF